MKKTLIAWVVLLLVCCASTFAAGDITYNLASDWSDISNPNGTWQLRAGNTNLSSFPTTYILADVNQPVWALSNTCCTGLPFWFRSIGAPCPGPGTCDWAVGDVVTHSWDPYNGGFGVGESNVSWTSPGSGTINISGDVWEGRQLGRYDDWILFVNGQQLASGSLIPGDGHTSANPFQFNNGALLGSLTGITVNTGDTVELLVETPQPGLGGDLVGVNMSINFAPVPEPSSLMFLGSGLVGLATTIRRRLRR